MTPREHGDRPMGRWALLALLLPTTILAAALYGVANDQVTVTVSPEYFSSFKHTQFLSALEAVGVAGAPVRVQAVIVGVLATWWMGLFLAPILWLFAAGGQWPIATRRQALTAVAWALGTTAALACLGSLAGWAVGSPITRVWVNGTETRVADPRPFTAVGWGHTFAYLGGVAGTVWAGRRCRRARAGNRPSGAKP